MCPQGRAGRKGLQKWQPAAGFDPNAPHLADFGSSTAVGGTRRCFGKPGVGFSCQTKPSRPRGIADTRISRSEDFLLVQSNAAEKWQPVGKGTSLAISMGLTCPTLPTDTIENIGENRRLSNRFDGAENGSADAPILGRRGDQNGNWNRARGGWLKAVTGDPDLSPMARLLAHVLATQF